MADIQGVEVSHRDRGVNLSAALVLEFDPGLIVLVNQNVKSFLNDLLLSMGSMRKLSIGCGAVSLIIWTSSKDNGCGAFESSIPLAQASVMGCKLNMAITKNDGRGLIIIPTPCEKVRFEVSHSWVLAKSKGCSAYLRCDAHV